MKNYFKRFMSMATMATIASLCVVFIFTFKLTVFASFDYTIQMNGKTVLFEPQAIEQNDRLLVPVIKIAEKLGADVSLNDSTNEIKMKKGSNIVQLNLGLNNALKNGVPVVLDVSAKTIDKDIYVPLRFVSETLGAKVNFNSFNWLVTIDYPVEYGSNEGKSQIYYDVINSGEYLYFCDSNYGGLWKMNLQTQQKECLYHDFNFHSVQCINLLDDWIYFSMSGGHYDMNHKYIDTPYDRLFRIKTDGSSFQQISDIPINSIFIANRKIYTLESGTSYPYSMNLDGSDLKRLTDYGYDDVTADEHYVYVWYGKRLAKRLDKDSNMWEDPDKTPPRRDRNLVETESGRYYLEQRYIKKLLDDGTSQILIVANNLTSFNVIGEYIYYSTSNYKEDPPAVYKASLNGTHIEKISDEWALWIFGYRDKVYLGNANADYITCFYKDSGGKENIYFK